MTRVSARRVYTLVTVSAAAYALAAWWVFDNYTATSIGPQGWLLIGLAIFFQFLAKYAFGKLFQDGLAREGGDLGGKSAFRAALVGAGVARLIPVGGAITPLAMSWATRGEDRSTVGAALRATILNYAGLLTLTGLTLIIIDLSEPIQWTGPGLLLIGLVCLGAGLVFMFGAGKLTALSRVARGRLRRWLDKTMLDHPADLRAQALIWGRVLSEAASLGLVLTAFGLTLTPESVGATFGITQLFAGIPGTPGGLGFAEAGLVGTLAVLGVSPAAAAGPTIVYRIVSYWLPAAAGLLAGGFTFLRLRDQVGDERLGDLPDPGGPAKT